MKHFPKKYTPKDLHNRSKSYKEILKTNTQNKTNTIFSPNYLPYSKKFSYNDFFSIYLKDFFNYKFLIKDSENLENNGNTNSYEQLFIIYGNHFQNLCSSYEFFNKKNQTLSQIGMDKLKKHIISTSRKNLNANNKIIESYLSSPHKIYIPDSDLYLYILEQFRSLWEKGKITKKTKIGYRSFNLQTSIPSQNISRKEEKKPYYILKYFVGAKCEALPVYLEDIDFCCGDVALLVHPKDKRYNKHIGKKAIIPLCNRQIPIIGDENVNIALNNGIQRICPCTDQESIYLAEKYGLPTDIYVFDKQGLYTNYIHEPAFIGQKRSKYYENIVGFINDIGNLSNKGEKIIKIPYLDHINERLVPYKMDQLIMNLEEEKEKILNNILEKKINFSFLDDIDFGDNDTSEELNITGNPLENDEPDEITGGKELKIRQKITNIIDDYIPNSLICNSQISYGWKIPLIKDSEGNLKFFDIENECLNRKEDSLQICFDFTLLSLIRSGSIGHYPNKGKDSKLCEYNKFSRIISENEKKILYFIQYLSKITGEKPEYSKFIKIIENLTDENNSTENELYKLAKNSQFLNIDGNRLLLNINGLINDIIDPDFIKFCIPCYLKNKGIDINNQIITSEKERNTNFKELLIQEILLGNTIYNTFFEESYTGDIEFLGDKQLTKSQIEQRQRDFFSIYGENPIRLNLLINKTFDQKEILLNSIFLKQIRNATRLCIQRDFLPKDIEKCLNEQPQNFDDFDIVILNKLNELYNNREFVKSYKDYTNFFISFKESIQNIFFSRYLEIQKIRPTKDVQFVSSYFFNFLLTILYPLVPEFVDALQYVSERNFIQPIKPIKLDKTTNYNMNILYNTFIKIKQIKIECNIKQHEFCNIFIKSTPTIGDMFAENEQIFKNYFHISEISYLRLHEINPLGYEVFSDDTVTIGIQREDSKNSKEKSSLETLERYIKDLDDKLNLIRQRLQLLPEGEDRKKAEEEYAKTKEEIENLTIKYSLLSSK